MIHIKLKKSEDDIRKLLFDTNIKEASKLRGSGIGNPNASTEWQEVSELRLFSKTIQFKPAGVDRHFNLGQLVNYMNNIYEDEDDTDFELFLSPQDFQLYQKRREIPNKTDILIFKPSYKIRPTPDMILEKLATCYNMSVVEKHEYVPEYFLTKSDFSLDIDSLQNVEIGKKEEQADRATPTIPPPRKKKAADHSRSGSPSVSTLLKKKARVATSTGLESSRSSSPATKINKH